MSVKPWNEEKYAISAVTLLCDYCGCKFRNKELLSNHILIHTDKINKFNCVRCKMKFANKKLLTQHAAQKHKKKIKLKICKNNKNNYKHQCVACHTRYLYDCQLKYHIRKNHFNLLSQTPYCNLKRVNQVWFEKVLNTNIMVEIKKIGNNNLLLRRLDPKTSIKATEMQHDIIDLRMMYPTESSMKLLKCRVCLKMCSRKELSKHFAEKHGHLMKRKCDSCKTTFKRLTSCVHHICLGNSVK